MAYDTTTSVTDDLTDNLASYHNQLKTAIDHVMSVSAYGAYVNAASMTGNVTLTDSDFPIQSFSPTAARDLTLPTVASTNHAFYVINRGSYTITVKNAGGTTITTVTPGSSAFLISDGSNGWYAVSGGGLTISSASVTTSNVTGVEGTLHNLDVSGMTANRDFNLPTPSEVGKRIGVRLSTGDDTYALLLKINAAEWSRIFITNEIVIFVSTGTGAGNWAVEHDGRIKQMAKMHSTAAQTLSTGVNTQLTFNTEVFDIGDIANISTERITVRRAGKYRVHSVFSIPVTSGSRPYLIIYKSGVEQTIKLLHGASTNNITLEASDLINSSAGDYFEVYVYQDTGSDKSTLVSSAFYYPRLSVEEVLYENTA